MLGKKGTVLLAGLAALAYYKYNKMDAAEKENLKDSLKKTGQKIVDQLPPEIKNLFGNSLGTNTQSESGY